MKLSSWSACASPFSTTCPTYLSSLWFVLSRSLLSRALEFELWCATFLVFTQSNASNETLTMYFRQKMQQTNGQTINGSLKTKDIKATWQYIKAIMFIDNVLILQCSKKTQKKEEEKEKNATIIKYQISITKVNVWWRKKTCHQKLTGVAPFLSKGGPMLLFFGGIYILYLYPYYFIRRWCPIEVHIGVSKSFLHLNPPNSCRCWCWTWRVNWGYQAETFSKGLFPLCLCHNILHS